MGTNLAGVRAVLFDAVGTLIRPEPSVAQAYWCVAQEFGSRLTADEIAARFSAAFAKFDCPAVNGLSRPPTNQDAERLRWQAIVAEVLYDLPVAANEPFEALWQHFAEARHWRLYDDVKSTWSALQVAGFALGIASNFDDRLTGICAGLPPLEQCAQEKLFWSARVGWPKPSPEFFALIERELRLSPREILLVGDNFGNDYLGATCAGWHAVHLRRSSGPWRDATHSAHTLAELIPLLLG